MPARNTIQFRRGYSMGYSGSQIGDTPLVGNTWTGGIQLAEGEVGYEINTGKFKIGRRNSSGTLITWENLDYGGGGGGGGLIPGSGIGILVNASGDDTIYSVLTNTDNNLTLIENQLSSLIPGATGTYYDVGLADNLSGINSITTSGDVTVGGTLNVSDISISVAAAILATGPLQYSGNPIYFDGNVRFTNTPTVGPSGSSVPVSLSGHQHTYSDITNFCSGVASCVDTSLTGSSGVQLVYNSGTNNLRIALSGEALAQHNLSTTGFISRSGTETYVTRTIAGGSNIQVTNGNGLAGDPTISLSGSVSGLTSLIVDNLQLDGNTISSTDSNGNIILSPNGTGDVYIDADTLRLGDANTNATITTNGSGDLILNTNAGTNSSSITIADAANGDITLNTNGTGEVNINRVDIDGGNIDGTTIGASSAASGNFTVVTVDNLKLDDNIIYRDNSARIDIASTETVINNPGSDIDFRVEGDTNANLLFVDASADRIGIGTSTPGHTLDVSGSGNFTGNLIIGGNLTVNGTTITANVSTMEVEDPILVLGLASGNIVTDTNYDRGLALVRNSTTTAFMGWDSSASEFIVLSSGSTSDSGNTYVAGTYGPFKAGILEASGLVKGRTLESTVSSPTAPMTIASTGTVANLSADYLDGQHGSHYLDWNNFTNIPDPTVSVSLTGDLSGSASTTWTNLSGNLSLSINATIQADSVALGTDTTGNYVGSVAVSGTGLSVSNNGAEGGTFTIGSNATPVNASGTIVSRDSSGNFSAGTITATLSGTATNALNIEVDTSSSNTNHLIFVNGIDGNLKPSVNSNLRFDATNNILIGDDATTPTTKIEYFILDGGTP